MAPSISTTQRKGKQSRGDPAAGSSKPVAGLALPRTIPHPEHHHTLNHLQQAAAYYSVLASTSALPCSSGSAACRLQGEMVRSATILSQKAVIRMDTGVKHAACRRCDSVWLDGLTVNVRNRVNGPHGHVVKMRCTVCGATQRRPAPDLVPKLDTQRGKQREGEGSTDKGVEEVTAQKRASQRERRRAVTIKRRLLRQSGSLSAKQHGADKPSTTQVSTVVQCSLRRSSPSSADPKPPPATEKVSVSKLSRTQRRQQRLARLSARASTPRSTTSASGSLAKKPPAPEGIALPFPSPPSPVMPSQSPLPEPDHGGTQRTRQAQRPHLPHFNDRVQTSGWDHALTTFNSLLSSQPQELRTDSEQYATQALSYWERASRSRGDHILVRGVGKNGSLGPVLP